MASLGHAIRWLGFAGVGLAVSYSLRALGVLARRAGTRRLGRARQSLGLDPAPPSSEHAAGSHRQL